MIALNRTLLLTAAIAMLAGCAGDWSEESTAGEEQVWIHRIEDGIAGNAEHGSPRSALRSQLLEDPPTARNLHALIEERYPDTIAFPELLRQLGASPQGRTLVAELLSELEVVTGVAASPAMVDVILDQPELVLDLMQVTPGQLAGVRDLMLRVVEEMGGLPALDAPLPGFLKSEYQLAQTFDYATIADDGFRVPGDDVLPIVDGVYLGVLRDRSIADEQLRENYIFAEVIERLAMNVGAGAGEVFTVVYGGQRITNLADFVFTLIDDGHQLSAVLRHYVAPFVPMYAEGPNDQLLPVAATAFLRTGFKDSAGIEAALPLFHSELVFSVSPGPATQGEGINAVTQYYQGIPKTGFYGEGSMERPRWLGEVVTDGFIDDEAAVAMVLAGYLVDVTRAVAGERNLPFDGWGISGVCNDSAAVVQQALRGQVTSYPLFMRDDLMVAELDARLAEDGQSSSLDQLVYLILRYAIDSTPEDVEPSPAALERLLLSFPWGPGEEPFYSAEDARRILAEVADTSE